MLQDKESVRTNSNLLSSLLQQTIAPLCKSLGNVKYAAIRTEAAALTELLLTTLNGVSLIPRDVINLKSGTL